MPWNSPSCANSSQHDNPGLKLDLVAVNGGATLGAGHGGMRVIWIYGGECEVFVPRGCRTQEGDGQPLPDSYAPGPLAPISRRRSVS